MAKWKNIALISTIVAPIAFGAGPIGDVLAAETATRPDYTQRVTDVTVHKYLNTNGGAENQNYYWGDGSALTDASNPTLGTVFGSAAGWEQANNEYKFTAYSLPGNAISGYNDGDQPKISDDADQLVDPTNLLKGKTYTIGTGADATTVTINDWADILQAVQGSASYETKGDNKSSWTIEVKPDLMEDDQFVKDFQAYLAANQDSTFVGAGDLDNTANGYQLQTDAKGELTFQDLPKNEWIVFETGAQDGVNTAVPMVLNLPMLKSDAKDPKNDNSWYGTLTSVTGDTKGQPAINLYPKDYTTAPNLKVAKVDQTGKKISGAEFVSFDWNATISGSLTGPEGLRSDLNSGAYEYTMTATAVGEPGSSGSTDVSYDFTRVAAGTEGAKPLAAYSTDEVKALLKQIYGITVLETGKTVNGEYTFSTGLKVHGTYGILETGTAANYDEVSGLRQITLDTADSKDKATGDGEDGHVYFNGSTYTVTNLPEPKPDKKINVADPINDEGATFDFSDFKDNDYSLGVSRGEHFQYTVDTDYNKNIANDVTADTGASGAAVTQTGYNKFTVVDTMDPEIDITDFTVGTYINGTYTKLAKYKIQGQSVSGGAWEDIATDGGFSGKYVALKAVLVTNYMTDVSNDELAASVNITVTPAVYPSTAATVPSTATGATITFDLVPGATSPDTIEDLSTNKFAQKMAALAKADASGSTPELRMLMNAQLNSAATVGEINNNVKATVTPVYGQPKAPSDDSKTFTAGWEFIKTDGSSEVLKGAGFDLSRVMDNNEMQDDRLLNGDSGISKFTANKDGSGALTSDAITALNKMADLLEADDKKDGSDDWTGAWKQGPNKDGSGTDTVLDTAEKALETVLHDADSDNRAQLMYNVLQAQKLAFAEGRTLYFAHLGADGLPEAEMRDTSEMGDVLWTIYPEFATTHYSDENGYFQYCGLASGPYKLTEVVAPSGYSATNKEIDFYLGNLALQNLPADATQAEKDAAAQQEADIEAYEDKGYQILLSKPSDDNIDGPAEAAKSGGAIAMIEAGKAVEVPNAQKSIFPLVGGIGTLFAVIAGLLAMGLALLKRKKDMKNEA